MLAEILTWATKLLSSASFIANPNLEARILLCNILSCESSSLNEYKAPTLSAAQFLRFKAMLKRRLLTVPIAYIIGHQEFWKYDFIVSKATLIPRPDSETLIEAILTDNPNKKSLRILELGVGSACLIISLLLENCSWQGVGVDISLKALKIARINASRYNLGQRMSLVQSNWFNSIRPQKFDLIISNPPYIAIEESNLMSLETLSFEPHCALFAKKNGLAAFQEIAKGVKSFLADNGKVYVEVGFNQSEAVTSLFNNYGYQLVNKYRDLSNITRCLQFQLQNP